MDLCESGQMTLEEELSHWWIRTRFLYLERAVKSACAQNSSLNILEAGCGTAQNMRYLRQISSLSNKIDRLTGLEPHIQQDSLHESWMGSKDQIYRSLEPIDALNVSYDLLFAMDVVEHIEDDRAALHSWLERCKPGARVFLTVPAFQSLWSYHDVLLGHQRRYTASTLKRLADDVGLRTRHITYAFGYVTPPVYIIRKLLPSKQNDSQSTDLKLPHPLLNSLLFFTGKLECALGGNPLFGTSVIGYFEKE